MATRRFESSGTALSWIPSEAITGQSKIPFELGVTHHDEPPPDRLEDLEQLRTSDRFREASSCEASSRSRTAGSCAPVISARATSGRQPFVSVGTRTATLWARTPGRVASVPHDALDSGALGSLAATHHREE